MKFVLALLSAVFVLPALWGPVWADGPQRNVVLLSVDTLRADHLSCYGHECTTSPYLSRFAATALVFDDCVCEVPLTNPSFGAMLSSLYPRMTGTTRNGLRMPDHVPLVTEGFKAAGYQTFCAQSNWTLKSHLSGLNRGFDIYRDGFHKRRWGLIKPERTAPKVTEVALELLAHRDKDRPFFMWVHYSDPHAPYKFHLGFDPAGIASKRDDQTQRVRARYDSEIAYTDYYIQQVLKALPENTAVVFVADHGESLYEHDYLGHGRRIYQTNMHVPLMIKAPGVQAGRSSAPVSTLDVGPTLLGLAGLTPAPGMLGRNLLGESVPAERLRFIETYGGAVPRLPGAKAVMADRPPMRRGLIANGWKLIVDGDGAQELFDLASDPLEQHNVAEQESERADEMRTVLDEWDRRNPRGQMHEVPLSSDDLRALESLGYLE